MHVYAFVRVRERKIAREKVLKLEQSEKNQDTGVGKEHVYINERYSAWLCTHAHLNCTGECVLEIARLRHRCELIRGFAGGRDEHPKIDG